jgi:hypothetical protein
LAPAKAEVAPLENSSPAVSIDRVRYGPKARRRAG